MGRVDVHFAARRYSPVANTENRRIKKTNLINNSSNNLATAAANGHVVEVDESSLEVQYMVPRIYRPMKKGGIFAELVLEQQVQDSELAGLLVQVSPQGNTILHIAAASGHCELVKRIMSNHGLNQLQKKRNLMGELPLHVAARTGHLSVVEAIVSCSKNNPYRVLEDHLLKSLNKERNTALHIALGEDHQSVAEFLVNADPTGTTSYVLNTDEISPLYMAAEAGCLKLVNLMVMNDNNSAAGDYYRNSDGQLKGKSPLVAAIRSKNTGILDTILSKEPTLVDSRNGGMSPLFFAASTGYLYGVCELLNISTAKLYERETTSLAGLLPIHIASMKGHVSIIQEFLDRCPDSRELLNLKGQNILHVAAKEGRAKTVSYMLKTGELEDLINQKDVDGNTPLHLAVMNWHPKIVSILTWNNRSVKLEIMNKDGLTAMDIVEQEKELSTFRQRLTWMALLSAGAPQANQVDPVKANLQSFMPKEESKSKSNSDIGEKYNNRVNTLLLVATLVATVTFAAGFTMPGGYNNNSDQLQGMATLASRRMFQVFLICNTIAMYSSITVVVLLIWAQQSDVHLISAAFRFAFPLLGVTLASMSLAFMAGVYIVVSNVTWLAYFVLITGSVFLVSLLVLLVPLSLPFSSSRGITRYITYYPFLVLVSISGSNIEEHV